MTWTELLIVACIVAILLGVPVGSYYSCTAQASAMNMDSRWGLLTGCFVEIKPGQWVPLKNLRVLP